MTGKPDNLRGHVLAVIVRFAREYPLPKALEFARGELGQLLDSFTIDELARAMEGEKND